MVVTCTFNDCENPTIPGSVKCAFHKNRRQCKSKGCNNQVYARNLCVRHGGKKQCHYEGCQSYARGGDYCIQHGGIVIKRFCIIEGCTKQAHAKQLCVRHGGGRLCRTAGCHHHAREGGHCHKHNKNIKKNEDTIPTPVQPKACLSRASLPTPELPMLEMPKWVVVSPSDILWTMQPELLDLSFTSLLAPPTMMLVNVCSPTAPFEFDAHNLSSLMPLPEEPTTTPPAQTSADPLLSDVLQYSEDLTNDISDLFEDGLLAA
ncbi:hypothetical protein THRCLA_20023 [Thraustotheca clavata]|uniref:Uncharacterized protein n=1 Tax=Thraustotheca clavata TaxID=74557 RepID=A0A1W0AD50_9STRA|nr:hypothetical protein THRCLA_20023 [Thraustotheca clavata]